MHLPRHLFLIQVASDRIALSLGPGRRMAVSVRDCGICGGELYPEEPTTAGTAGGATGTAGLGASLAHGGHGHGQGQGGGLGNVQLACKHLFHLDCIRWGLLLVSVSRTCQGTSSARTVTRMQSTFSLADCAVRTEVAGGTLAPPPWAA